MDISQLLVNLISVAFIAWIVWYFWLYRKEGVQVTDVAGVQEVPITVRGGYDPDVIVVKQGKPVRLLFTRQESSLCSEMVVFDKINQSAKLPEGKTVAIEFTPETSRGDCLSVPDGYVARQDNCEWISLPANISIVDKAKPGAWLVRAGSSVFMFPVLTHIPDGGGDNPIVRRNESRRFNMVTVSIDPVLISFGHFMLRWYSLIVMAGDWRRHLDR
jgi:hypothetical protein